MFDATYDAAGAASAERAFCVRSVRELRPFLTLGPPIACSVVVAACLALSGPVLLVAYFTSLLILSVLGEFFFYVARPLKAKRLALKYPVRRITFTPQSVQIAVGGQTANIAWSRIKHVWDAGAYVLLNCGVRRRNMVAIRCLRAFVLATVACAMASCTYVTGQNSHNQVSLDLIDYELSNRLNRERNVDFKLPPAR